MYFLFKMGIFHCYVCLPEGNSPYKMIESRHPIERLYHPNWQTNYYHYLEPPKLHFNYSNHWRSKSRLKRAFCVEERCFAMNRNGDISQEGLNRFSNLLTPAIGCYWGGLILLTHSPIDRQLKRILSADNPTMAPLSWTGKVAFVDKVSWVPRTTCTSILDMICTHRIDVWYIYVYLPTFTWSLSVFHRWIYHTLILWSTCIYNWNPVDLYVFTGKLHPCCRVNSNHKICSENVGIFQV